MATLISRSPTAVTGLHFGLSADESTLITQKVDSSKKIKKKDLRGYKGGYKVIASYNPTSEVTIEGAVGLDGAVPTAFALAAAYTALGNDPLAVGGTLHVDSIGVREDGEDFKKATVKLSSSTSLG